MSWHIQSQEEQKKYDTHMPDIRQQVQVRHHRKAIGANTGTQRNIGNDERLSGEKRQGGKYCGPGEYQKKRKCYSVGIHWRSLNKPIVDRNP